MEKEVPQFGKKEEGAEYIPRPGVYAIIVDSKGNFAVVEVKDKYFLLGGGLNDGELEEEGLRREVMEEAGREISALYFLGKANEYFKTTSGYFNKMMSFYKVELKESLAIESNPTHIFRWITKGEFRLRARHEAQVYGVENLLN